MMLQAARIVTVPFSPLSVSLNRRLVRSTHLILGRSSTDATITLKCPTASRVHALLVYNGMYRCGRFL